MRGLLVILVFSLLIVSCTSKNQNVDYYFHAEQLKDHPDTSQVKKIMDSEPDSSFYRLFFGKQRFVQLYYAQDSAEFRFKDGKLIEAIINKPSLEYTPEAITKFGLPLNEPTERDSSAFFMWKDVYEGFDVVNFYMVGSKKGETKINYKIYFNLSSI